MPRIAALIAGPAMGVVLWMLCEPARGADGLPVAGSPFSPQGAIVMGLLAWMAIWWATQAVELGVTALLPVVFLPLLGVASVEKTLSPFANDLIFLFGGGCIIGLAIERHGLGERLLHWVLAKIGRSPGRVIVAFLIVTASISAWVSNTATTLMMLPLAMAALALYSRGIDRNGHHGRALANFEKGVLLSVCYGATIGGVITLLGSAPNPIAAEWIRASGGSMSFLRWSSVALPIAVLMMAVAVVVFRVMLPTRGLPVPSHDPAARDPVPMTRAAWVTIAVFALAVVGWIGGPFVKEAWPAIQIRDGLVGIVAAMLLLTIPAAKGSATAVVPWSKLERVPWGVFIVFGGGLSLADAMQATGVSKTVAMWVAGMGSVPEIVAIGAVVAALVFSSEIASNTALTATAVPIVGAVAPGLGVGSDTLVVAAAMGASLAFMLPVGTPPNALVYATGRVGVRDMLRVGLVLNIASIIISTIVCRFLL